MYKREEPYDIVYNRMGWWAKKIIEWISGMIFFWWCAIVLFLHSKIFEGDLQAERVCDQVSAHYVYYDGCMHNLLKICTGMYWMLHNNAREGNIQTHAFK